YHCYQDANRDPNGIDRLKGRLYRVRYTGKDVNRAGGVSPLNASTKIPKDLGTTEDAQLIEFLGHPNVWVRETSLRLIQERRHLETTNRLMKLVRDESTPTRLRRTAYFAATPTFFDRPNWGGDEFWDLLEAKDRALAAWMVRTFVEQAVPRSMRHEGQWEPLTQMMVEGIILSALEDPSPEVRLQALTFLARRVTTEPAGQVHTVFDKQLLAACRLCGDDPLLQRIAWQAIKSYSSRYPALLTVLLTDSEIQNSEFGKQLTPRIVEWLLARPQSDAPILTAVLRTLIDNEQNSSAMSVLNQLAQRVQSGELKGDALKQLRNELEPMLKPLLGVESTHPLRLEASLLALSWRDSGAVGTARSLVMNPAEPPQRRLA
ncbi:MAG: hypothetical protein B7Z55_17075, partial [Planctomycetales bacterium 12-60-4]